MNWGKVMLGKRGDYGKMRECEVHLLLTISSAWASRTEE